MEGQYACHLFLFFFFVFWIELAVVLAIENTYGKHYLMI